ncbi:MAG: chiA1 3 [Chitinophagaceae bacterium]|nr:chiA1 3 [Chitinophagaceae bacterium]
MYPTLKKSVLLFTLVIGALFVTTTQAQFKVIGYYPTYAGGYPNGVNNLDLAKITHLYIAFANPDGAGNLVPSYGTTANITTVVNAAHAKNVKVFMSIGGGGASGTNYQTLLSSTANINAFVTKIAAFATTYNLDGIDVDIEGNILDGNTLTAVQYQNFVTALGTALHNINKKMSSALGTWFGQYVTSTAANQFDWINMMSYDLYGSWTGPGQHAPYTMTTDDFQYWNTTKGVPASRLVVGLPFYGYGWGSLYSAGIAYCDIVNTYPNSQNNDQVGSGGNVIYYNGIPTIKQKTTYAAQNAAGVMIWELTQDCATSDSRSLLLAVSQVLAPLPVTWLDFSAWTEGQFVKLDWSTAKEEKNGYFVVESSIDGLSFQAVDRVVASGNTTAISRYTYLDTQPLSNPIYYRIKQVDTDGASTYTSIVYVQWNSADIIWFDVHPNPATQQEIQVQFNHASEAQQLELTDLLGATYYSEILTAQQVKETHTIKLNSIRPGIYILSATGNGKQYRVKVIVN